MVERLLNLQSVLVGFRSTAVVPDHEAVGEAFLAHESNPDQPETSSRPQAERPDMPADHREAKSLRRPDWTTEGAAVFADLSARLGRRPSAREFQGGLTVQTRTLIAEGRLAAGTRPPSITTTKRVRAALEASSPPKPSP